MGLFQAVFCSSDRKHFSGPILHGMGVGLLIILVWGLTSCPHHCLYHGISHI